MSYISIRNLSKYYESRSGRIEAVESISMNVSGNETVCVVGPSGCGKSTIINIVAGFIMPSSGKVLIDGKPVNETSGRCGVVFQRDAVFPWLEVRDNVAYGLRSDGAPSEVIEETVTKFLDLVGLDGYENAWPRELSGGMRKRVELARAYAADPEILLLDEPFGSLDVLTREEMQLLLMKVLQEQPKTVLLVTHDVEEALFLGQRVVVMSSSPGSIREVFDVPFEFPRDRSLKLTSQFVDLRQEVIDAMKQSPTLSAA